MLESELSAFRSISTDFKKYEEKNQTLIKELEVKVKLA